MTIGFRPQGESGPLYHPERDYAYITPTLMRIAIERLDGKDLSEEALAWKNKNNITDTEIAVVAESLARAQRDFVNASDPVDSLEQALSRRDFYAIRFPVRQFLFSVIGEVICGAWFKAVRDVSVIGEVSPANTEMAEFSAAVRQFTSQVRLPIAQDIALESISAWNDVLQTRCKLLGQKVEKLSAELATYKKAPTPAPSRYAVLLSGLKTLSNLLGLSPS